MVIFWVKNSINNCLLVVGTINRTPANLVDETSHSFCGASIPGTLSLFPYFCFPVKLLSSEYNWNLRKLHLSILGQLTNEIEEKISITYIHPRTKFLEINNKNINNKNNHN